MRLGLPLLIERSQPIYRAHWYSPNELTYYQQIPNLRLASNLERTKSSRCTGLVLHVLPALARPLGCVHRAFLHSMSGHKQTHNGWRDHQLAPPQVCLPETNVTESELRFLLFG